MADENINRIFSSGRRTSQISSSSRPNDLDEGSVPGSLVQESEKQSQQSERSDWNVIVPPTEKDKTPSVLPTPSEPSAASSETNGSAKQTLQITEIRSPNESETNIVPQSTPHRTASQRSQSKDGRETKTIASPGKQPQTDAGPTSTIEHQNIPTERSTLRDKLLEKEDSANVLRSKLKRMTQKVEMLHRENERLKSQLNEIQENNSANFTRQNLWTRAEREKKQTERELPSKTDTKPIESLLDENLLLRQQNQELLDALSHYQQLQQAPSSTPESDHWDQFNRMQKLLFESEQRIATLEQALLNSNSKQAHHDRAVGELRPQRPSSVPPLRLTTDRSITGPTKQSHAYGRKNQARIRTPLSISVERPAIASLSQMDWNGQLSILGQGLSASDREFVPEEPSPSNRESMLENDLTERMPFEPEMAGDIRIGYQVKFIRSNGRLGQGTVKYVGPITSSISSVYLGVELTTPDGTHDGVFRGRRYYSWYGSADSNVKQPRNADKLY